MRLGQRERDSWLWRFMNLEFCSRIVVPVIQRSDIDGQVMDEPSAQRRSLLLGSIAKLVPLMIFVCGSDAWSLQDGRSARCLSVRKAACLAGLLREML